MKDIYELLNDVRAEDFNEIELSEKEKTEMKKRFNKSFKRGHKKYFALAACVAAVAVISQTAFAQTFMENIIKSITTGHNRFMLTEKVEKREIPDKYKGIFYDKDGNLLDEISEGQPLYNDKGEMLMNENGDVVKEFEAEASDGSVIYVGKSKDDEEMVTNERQLVLDDINAAREMLNFAPAVPEYLPEGYELYKAVLFKDGENVSGDYCVLYYDNAETGKRFSIHERIINDENAYEASAFDSISETDIKGFKGVIMDNSSIDWEEGDISVSVIAGMSEINIDELTKIARSTVR